tara:strand:- start:1234 stop:1842 length:609 start_codon:yes stop_codon:yes gene_type:complete
MLIDTLWRVSKINILLIPLTYFLILAFYNSIQAQEKTMILDNLSTPGKTTQRQNWAFFTDGVMGGLSEGKAIISNIGGKNCYHMTGNVTTENNGGFIQIRNQLNPAISTKDYKGIYFKVYGNNEEYSIHLRTSMTMAPWQYYKYSFKSYNEWNEIRAPFKEFTKSNIYQPSKLLGQKIKSVGLVAGFKDFTADICLSEIGFY